MEIKFFILKFQATFYCQQSQTKEIFFFQDMLCGRFFKPSIGNVPKHLNGFLLCTAILFHSSCFWVRLIKAFIIEGTSKSSVDIIIVLQFIKDLYEAFKLVRRALSKRSYFMMTHINVLRSP